MPPTDALLAWAADLHKQHEADIVFLDAAGGQPLETLRLPAAYCVAYHEQFVSGDAATGAYQCTLMLSDPTGWTLEPGGPTGAFVAPAAGQHGAPGAGAAVVPAAISALRTVVIGGGPVAQADVHTIASVPRLPRITGDPPFTIKGHKNGKPGLDRAEFVRQLTGQQDGLNQLTVATFIANRDAYLQRAKTNRDGRDPKGDAAQKIAREKALERKVQELQLADDDLTESEAIAQANDWMKTQTALHDPDQIAGGHASIITGMGDSRVNSSIGAQWVKHGRIDKIDSQIRIYAANMTQMQLENTFLNIELPVA